MNLNKTIYVEHLSDEQLADLYKRYKDGERVFLLLQEYVIYVHPSRLHKVIPPQKLDEKCEKCGGDMYEIPQSRSSYCEPNKTCIACDDTKRKSTEVN